MFNEFAGATAEDMLGNGVVRGLYEQLQAQQPAYQKIDAYMRGEHPLTFATEKFSNAFGLLFRAYANNYCKRIVAALSDYLQLSRLSTPDARAQAVLDDFWDRQRLDMQSGRVHADAFTYGDGYAIVERDSAGSLRFYQQNCRTVRVLYSAEQPDRIVLAVKLWQRLDKAWRLNVYAPGLVYRYQTKDGRRISDTSPMPSRLEHDFLPLNQPGEAPVLRTASDILPVFHWPNEPGGDGLGTSELNDLFPLQDALNKTGCDKMVGMEFMALPQRYATGIEVDVDEATGKTRAPMVSAADRLFFSGNENARFGAFPVTDAQSFLEIEQNLKHDMAALARVPLHHIMMGNGQFPSGESLKTSEQPLIAKIRDRQVTWGEAWERVGSYVLEVNGLSKEGDARDPEAEWQDLTPRSDVERSQAELNTVNAKAVKLSLGVSEKQILAELGYTDDQIQQFAADNQITAEAAAAKMLQTLTKEAGAKDVAPVAAPAG